MSSRLSNYCWPCHTELPNKHPPLATLPLPVGSSASSVKSSTDKDGKQRTVYLFGLTAGTITTAINVANQINYPCILLGCVVTRRALVTVARRLVHSCIIMNGDGSAHIIRGSCELPSESEASFCSNGSRAQLAADVTGASLFQMTFKALGLKGHPTSAVQRVKVHQSILSGYKCTDVTMKLTNMACLSSHQSLKLVTVFLIDLLHRQYIQGVQREVTKLFLQPISLHRYL